MAGESAPRLDEATLASLARELQALTTEALGQALAKLFAGADDALFEMVRKAANNRDQARLLDAMRAVRLGRAWIQQSFAQEIERRFAPAPPRSRKAAAAVDDPDDLALADSVDLDKSIAITNIANRANELYKQALWQLDRLLGTLIHAGHATIPPRALTPVSFCEAFRIAVDGQVFDSHQALVLYKLFDRFVIPELGKLYPRLLEVFDRHSIRPEKITISNPQPQGVTASDGIAGPTGAARDSTAAAPAAQPPPPRRAAESAAPTDPPTVTAAASLPAGTPGAATLRMLQPLQSAMHRPQPSRGYSDQDLASDLIGAALGRAVPGWTAAHAQAYVRRTDAVGQMFADIVDEPEMPGELKPRFDELRFTVMKTALQDLNFFANPAHPVRRLVNDLAMLAAAARATSVDTLRRVNELVGQIQDQFRVAAESVRQPRVDPLESAEIESFLSDQINRNRERRKAVIEKAKRVVEEELQVRCARHNVPHTALTLLRSGWAPMMAAHLLRSGIDSASWREGLDLLESILTALDPAAPPPADGPAALVALIDRHLSDVGMIGTRRKELVEAFLPALRQAEIRRRALAATAQATGESRPASAPPVDRDRLLQALVVPGSWFQIVDPASGQGRWMKAVTYYPGHGNVEFAEFNGRNPLYIDLEPFLDRLRDGTITPLELLPMARDLLDRYRPPRSAATA